MKRSSSQTNAQRGSALFIILVGVMLFAALSYTVAQMMRGGNPNTISEEKSKLYAEDILNYVRAVRQAVQNVKISGGCADTGISFENNAITGYEHTPPAADACKVFNDSGGAVNYIAPDSAWLDLNFSPAPLRGEWLFPMGICVSGTGTAASGCQSDGVDNEALVTALLFLHKEVCIQINELIGITNPGGNPPTLVPAGSTTFAKFTGTQTDGASIDTGGQMMGCYEGVGGALPAGTYGFFAVLLPR